MPRMDAQIQSPDRRTMILAYGPAKMRKTTWALQAAEAGFNVIMCDFDHSYHVASSLSPEAQARIYHLDMRLPEGSVQNPLGYHLMKSAEGNRLWANENDRQFVAVSKVEPEREYFQFDFTKFTANDIIVIDSWTAFTTHLTAAMNPVMDATQVSKLEWDDIAKMRHAMDLFLLNLTKCKAHVIVTGHSEQNAKRKKDVAANEKPEIAIESIRTQPMSVSRPHAETLAKNFTDVLIFSKPSASMGVYLSTQGSDDVDAGSRMHPPFKGKFDEWPFTKFVSEANLASAKQNTNFSSEGILFSTGEEISAKRAALKGAADVKVGSKPSILNRKKV